MTPAARTQAAIELLDQIITAARTGGAAADTLIARYFATRRYAGSKDRRAVRELAYAAIRLCGEIPESGRTAMLALANTDPEVAGHFTGDGHGPAPVGAGDVHGTALAGRHQPPRPHGSSPHDHSPSPLITGNPPRPTLSSSPPSSVGDSSV